MEDETARRFSISRNSAKKDFLDLSAAGEDRFCNWPARSFSNGCFILGLSLFKWTISDYQISIINAARWPCLKSSRRKYLELHVIVLILSLHTL